MTSSDFRPYRALMAAIVLQAVRDLRYTNRHVRDGTDGWTAAGVRERAKGWLQSDRSGSLSVGCRTYCEALGIDFGTVAAAKSRQAFGKSRSHAHQQEVKSK